MIETVIAVTAGVKLGVDFLAGLGKGIANIFGADDERNHQINTLKYQNALLESERTESQRRFEVSQREGNTSTAQATVERDTMASFNAQAGVLGNKEAYEEYNNQRLQATQLQGQIEASTALSGFRRSGTQERKIEQTDTQISRQLSMARDRANLSIASSYLGYASAYDQSTRQIDAYRRQLDELEQQHAYDLKMIDTQITENKGMIAGLEEDRDSAWQGFLDFLSGWF